MPLSVCSLHTSNNVTPQWLNLPLSLTLPQLTGQLLCQVKRASVKNWWYLSKRNCGLKSPTRILPRIRGRSWASGTGFWWTLTTNIWHVFRCVPCQTKQGSSSFSMETRNFDRGPNFNIEDGGQAGVSVYRSKCCVCVLLPFLKETKIQWYNGPWLLVLQIPGMCN